jgi:hypothetical protein
MGVRGLRRGLRQHRRGVQRAELRGAQISAAPLSKPFDLDELLAVVRRYAALPP